jgi:nicotinamidase-related amidase
MPFDAILLSMPDLGTALVVIDVQNESLVGCAGAPRAIARINELSRRATEAGVPVILIQHDDPAEGMGRGSAGWELAEALDQPEGAHVVGKSYRDAFSNPELAALLERLGVGRLVVTGLHSDFCVQMTALSAVVRGYDLVFVSDAHATIDWQAPALQAAEITALVNSRMAMLRHPGRSVEVLPAADVAL